MGRACAERVTQAAVRDPKCPLVIADLVGERYQPDEGPPRHQLSRGIRRG
jgi:hypothetical protein